MRLFPIIRVRVLIALWCLHVTSQTITPVYMQFPLFAKNCGKKTIIAIIHIPHCTAQMTDSERADVFTATVLIYLHLIHNDFVRLYCTLFRRHRNVMNVFAYMLPSCSRRFWMRVRNTDWWQWARNAMLSSPSFLGARPVIHVHHGRMRTLVRAVILQLRCLHACIFRLKSAYATYVNTIMLAAIMSLITLFKSKYCVNMR